MRYEDDCGWTCTVSFSDFLRQQEAKHLDNNNNNTPSRLVMIMQSGHIHENKTGDGSPQAAGADIVNDKQPCPAVSVTQLAAESITSLRQLWRELGISRADQAREEDALLRDVKSLYERKVQFYQDEHELSSKRIAVLQREIAHIHWLFRDDEPHEVRFHVTEYAVLTIVIYDLVYMSLNVDCYCTCI